MERECCGSGQSGAGSSALGGLLSQSQMGNWGWVYTNLSQVMTHLPKPHVFHSPWDVLHGLPGKELVKHEGRLGSRRDNGAWPRMAAEMRSEWRERLYQPLGWRVGGKTGARTHPFNSTFSFWACGGQRRHRSAAGRASSQNPVVIWPLWDWEACQASYRPVRPSLGKFMDSKVEKSF